VRGEHDWIGGGIALARLHSSPCVRTRSWGRERQLGGEIAIESSSAGTRVISWLALPLTPSA